MNKKSSYNPVNGGVSLILLTFIILSLVSFAALSIVSARADARLTEKYRQQTEYYYGARNEAQKFLQEQDGSGPVTRRFAAGPHMDLILTVDSSGVICEKTESTVTYNYDSTLPVMKR
ncbi:MAG: hypothetical protein IJT43_11655 [Stomatobaculum sp.]|nr:hypothetical protein [Stomatobaculum sp.]